MMDGVTISLIGLTVTLLAYLCAGFYWGGRVSAKLDNVVMWTWKELRSCNGLGVTTKSYRPVRDTKRSCLW